MKAYYYADFLKQYPRFSLIVSEHQGFLMFWVGIYSNNWYNSRQMQMGENIKDDPSVPIGVEHGNTAIADLITRFLSITIKSTI